MGPSTNTTLAKPAEQLVTSRIPDCNLGNCRTADSHIKQILLSAWWHLKRRGRRIYICDDLDDADSLVIPRPTEAGFDVDAFPFYPSVTPRPTVAWDGDEFLATHIQDDLKEFRSVYSGDVVETYSVVDKGYPEREGPDERLHCLRGIDSSLECERS